MKFYARVNSIEKKEVVSEDKDGKKVKKLLHLAKLAEIGGVRVRLVSEAPFDGFAVGSTMSISITATQTKLPVEAPGAKAKAEPAEPRGG